MMIYDKNALKDKNIFFFDTGEVPELIEVSERGIRIVGPKGEVIIPKDSLRGKAILDRLVIGKESEISQEIYL